MKNIQLLNKIAKIGTDKLDPALYNIGAEVAAPEGIMVRSANMLDMDFNPELLAIARAGLDPVPRSFHDRGAGLFVWLAYPSPSACKADIPFGARAEKSVRRSRRSFTLDKPEAGKWYTPLSEGDDDPVIHSPRRPRQTQATICLLFVKGGDRQGNKSVSFYLGVRGRSPGAGRGQGSPEDLGDRCGVPLSSGPSGAGRLRAQESSLRCTHLIRQAFSLPPSPRGEGFWVRLLHASCALRCQRSFRAIHKHQHIRFLAGVRIHIDHVSGLFISSCQFVT